MSKETLNSLTKVEITEHIDWDLDTGIGVYNKNRGRQRAGAEAGTYHPNGYRRVQIKGKMLFVHRVIYFLKHGHCPKELDHIDGIRDKNSISNLRECTHQENMRNRRANKNNASGYKGVYWHKQRKKWIALIMINGKKNHLGSFKTAKEASDTYEMRAKKEFGEFYKEQNK